MDMVYILYRCIWEDTPWEDGEWNTKTLGVFKTRAKAEAEAKADDIFPTKEKTIIDERVIEYFGVSNNEIISVFSVYDDDFERYRITYYVKEMNVQ
jgi:hypothetical protein